MKLSAGAATACLLEEEIPPLSPKEAQKTAKTWSRRPNWSRRSTLMEMSFSDLHVSANPPDHGYLASGEPSFHRESSKMFTRTVDHWDVSCGEMRWDSRLWGFLFKCSAPKDHSVFWTLRVVWAPTPHDAHLIWVDPRRNSLTLFTRLVEYSMKNISGKLQNYSKHYTQKTLL